MVFLCWDTIVPESEDREFTRWANALTHLPLDKMAANSQRIVLDSFLWMKSFVFWLFFFISLKLVPKFSMDNKPNIGLYDGLAPNMVHVTYG